MAKFELKLPKMGESVAEATITNWLKEVGDHIEVDEAVFEIATDKVDTEVNAPPRYSAVPKPSSNGCIAEMLPPCRAAAIPHSVPFHLRRAPGPAAYKPACVPGPSTLRGPLCGALFAMNRHPTTDVVNAFPASAVP